MGSAKYGVNHEAVERFIDQLAKIPWFSRVGQPMDDENIIQVDFDFIVNHHHDPYAPFGTRLIHAEERIERLVFDHRRMDEEEAVRKDCLIRGNEYLDEFANQICQKYPGYYGNTYMYAHELFEFPDRLVRGAGFEIMLEDIDPTLQFFRALIPWFENGHWPCGLDDTHAEPRLVIW